MAIIRKYYNTKVTFQEFPEYKQNYTEFSLRIVMNAHGEEEIQITKVPGNPTDKSDSNNAEVS